MGFFRKLLATAAPIVGGIFGGPAGAAVGAGIGGMISGGEKANDQTRVGAQAGQTAMGGANAVRDINQPYTAAGAAANTQQAGLLGIGGDPAAAGAGYDNYLKSVGYQGQMRAGQQAITSSAAARGLMGSGSTAKALQAHGTQLNAQNFNNYLGQLGGVANRGLSATGQVGNAALQGSGDAARYEYGAGGAATESRAGGWDALIGGLGTAYDAWSAGKAKTPPPGSAYEPQYGGAGGIPVPAAGRPRWG